MSLSISTLSPSGNLIMASDTRVCKSQSDGTCIVIRDDVSKTIQIDKNTFVFMSGVLDAARFAVDTYTATRSGDVQKDRQLLTKIMRTVYDMVPAEGKANEIEVAVIYLVRLIGNDFWGELYLHSYKNYEPLVSQYVPDSVRVFGSYMSGTDDHIRAVISSAQTEAEMISAFHKVYNEQCRPEVGGTMELFKVSHATGATEKMSFAIKGDKNV